MTAILGIWSGISIGDYSNLTTWPVVPENELAPYVQEAIDEIHFITDAANASKWGALRAQYGRPEPYPLKYVEM
jgi:alpha-N-arabinofuranosidase